MRRTLLTYLWSLQRGSVLAPQWHENLVVGALYLVWKKCMQIGVVLDHVRVVRVSHWSLYWTTQTAILHTWC